MRFIGDVHGYIDDYISIAKQVEESVQVGDMGVGFPSAASKLMDEKLKDFQEGSQHRFIRGNHDNPSACVNMPGYIPDGFYDDARGIMYIGGAFSIDHAYRTIDHDLWEDEQLSYSELNCVIDAFLKHKPQIVVTHDCPKLIATKMFFANNNSGNQLTTRTASAFDSMYLEYQPILWVFGHWHNSAVYEDPETKTKFVCLDELNYMDVNI
jgi:hypothetical protein